MVTCIVQQGTMSDSESDGRVPVVIDAGSITCRAGLADDDTPQVTFPCIVGRSKVYKIKQIPNWQNVCRFGRHLDSDTGLYEF